MKKIASTFLLCTLLQYTVYPVVIIVNSTGDEPNVSTSPNPPTPVSTSGKITLRSAIQFSQGTGTPDFINTILFDIPKQDPGYQPITDSWMIRPRAIAAANAAYFITNKPVIVNGYAFPGALFNTARPNTNPFELGTNAQLKIEIRGPGITTTSLATALLRAFRINNVQGCQFRGLCFTAFAGSPGLSTANAIDFRNATIPAPGNLQTVFSGCFFGIDITGTSVNDPITGEFLLICRSVFVIPLAIGGGARNVRIGGPLPEDSNLFGSSLANAAVFTSSVLDSLIQRNYFGTDRTGTKALGHLDNGIRLDSINGTFGRNNRVENNLITGCFISGLTLDGFDYTIINNLIGTDITGKKKIGNSTGINIISFMGNSGRYRIENNVISGNKIGIRLGQPAGSTIPIDIQFVNCKIGTDITGTFAIPNVKGMWAANAQNTVIDSCTISGNCEEGVLIAEFSRGTVIKNSFIGTTSTGKKALGNGRDGIKIGIGGQVPLIMNTLIGGASSAASNVISANKKNGVKMVSFANANEIRHNIIGSSTKLGKKSDDFGNGKNGISLECSSDNKIIDNCIKNNEKNGIKIADQSCNTVLEGNIFKNNEKEDVLHCNEDCI